MKERDKVSIKEMLLNFRLQYPKKVSSYGIFFQKDICLRNQEAIQRAVLIYNNFLKDMTFLIDLIREQRSN